MATIRIKNLKLKAIIGTNDWERKTLQPIVINVTIEFDGTKASLTDNIKDTVDYKTITKEIIKAVEPSQYFLLEKLTASILSLVMKHKGVRHALVEIDKPKALRYSDSVSLSMSKSK